MKLAPLWSLPPPLPASAPSISQLRPTTANRRRLSASVAKRWQGLQPQRNANRVCAQSFGRVMLLLSLGLMLEAVRRK